MPSRRTPSASDIRGLVAELQRVLRKIEPLASTAVTTDQEFERSAVATLVQEVGPNALAQLKNTASIWDDPREPKKVGPAVLRLFDKKRKKYPKISVNKAAKEISEELPGRLFCGPDHVRRILGKAGKARQYSKARKDS